MIFKFLVSVTHSFILHGWTMIFQVLMDTFIKKKRENGTVQSITPPVGSIKQNVYLHSDQVLGMLKNCLSLSTKTPTNPHVRKLFICIRKKQFAF